MFSHSDIHDRLSCDCCQRDACPIIGAIIRVISGAGFHLVSPRIARALGKIAGKVEKFTYSFLLTRL